MVIMRTSATEVIIQAVSPELGVHFSSTAFFGSGSLAQAGGGVVAAGAAAAGAAGAAPGAVWAYDAFIAPMLSIRPSRTASASAPSLARDNFRNVMVSYSCRIVAVRIRAPRRRSRRC